MLNIAFLNYSLSIHYPSHLTTHPLNQHPNSTLGSHTCARAQCAQKAGKYTKKIRIYKAFGAYF